MLLNILQGPGQSPPQRVIGPNFSSAKAEKNLQSTMGDLVGFEQKSLKGCGCRCLHQPARKSAGTRISHHINGETPQKLCGNNQCFRIENPVLNDDYRHHILQSSSGLFCSQGGLRFKSVLLAQPLMCSAPGQPLPLLGMESTIS